MHDCAFLETKSEPQSRMEKRSSQRPARRQWRRPDKPRGIPYRNRQRIGIRPNEDLPETHPGSQPARARRLR